MRRTEYLWARCEPDLKETVQALARENRRGVSDVVRDAVTTYLKRRRRWPPDEPAPRQTMEAAQ